MKAVVVTHLEHKTRHGHLSLSHTIVEKKEKIVDSVNSWISERCSKENWIKVVMFETKILDHNKKVVKSWEYKPTYR